MARAETATGSPDAATAPIPPIGFAIAITAASLFAWLGPLSRWAYERGMEPLSFVAWRAGIAAAAIALVLVVLRGRVRRVPVPARQWVVLGFAALMGLTLNLSVFAAFDRISVAVALIGFYTYPAMVAAVAIGLGREHASGPVLAALALALAGMAIVVAGSITPGGITIDPLGVLLALAAAASQTVFITITRDGYPDVPSVDAVAVILGGSFLGCLVIGVATGQVAALAVPIGRTDLLGIVAVAGIAVAAVPTLLFLRAIRLIGGTRAGILMLLEPVIGVGLAAILLGETLQPIQLLGAAAVLAAAVLLQRSGAGTATSAPPTV